MPPRRPVKVVRKEWDEARLTALNRGTWLPCVDNPIPFTEIRQTPEDAEDLCYGCPLAGIHHEYGYAAKLDHEVAGGSYWIRGKPLKIAN